MLGRGQNAGGGVVWVTCAIGSASQRSAKLGPNSGA
ncbi:hypothetical protein NB689_003539 [Xanthomonas sacchari]|nr:hypothetical protein [Xanthomonas sacchari]